MGKHSLNFFPILGLCFLCPNLVAPNLQNLQLALQNLGVNFLSVQNEQEQLHSSQCDSSKTLTEVQQNLFSMASACTSALHILALSQSLTSQQMGITNTTADAHADEEPDKNPQRSSAPSWNQLTLQSPMRLYGSRPTLKKSSTSRATEDQAQSEKSFEASKLEVPNFVHQLLSAILPSVAQSANNGEETEGAPSAISSSPSAMTGPLDGIVGGGLNADGQSSCFWANLTCDSNAKYRTMDGSCNNLRHPSWGAGNSIHRRFVPNRYNDRISAPREFSVSRGYPKLLNVRKISTILSHSITSPSKQASLLLTAVGQFLDHDITKTPQSNLTCCNKTEECLSKECFPIQVPANDAFFQPLGVTCLNFIRTIPGIREDCSLGPREQMNQNSHFIDASQVYGSSRTELETLRNFVNGQLRFRNGATGDENDQETDIRNQFPPINHACPASRGGAPADPSLINPNIHTCILAGDTRANVQPGLQLLHVIFLRLHNFIAAFIHENRPQFSDEKIFQETRKIVIAQWQTIVYGEFLPVVLGLPAVKSGASQLWVTKYQYNRQLRVGTRNEFVTAAYRFGHTTIMKHIPKSNLLTGRVAASNLSENFFSPFLIYGRGVDELGNGFRKSSAKKVNRQMTDELQNLLFKAPDQKYGTDLYALNMQRGRDHGMGTYNDLRRFCGLPVARRIWDLYQSHPEDAVHALDKAYRGVVEDIDLFAGGVSEKPLYGALVGPTFACIIWKQFHILRNGDRFWHENTKEFSLRQQKELHRTRLARLICDFTNNLSVQPHVLKLVSSANPTTKCTRLNNIPRVDYSVFLSSM